EHFPPLFSPDGRLLLVARNGLAGGPENGAVHVWDIADPSRPQPWALDGREIVLSPLAFSPHRRSLAGSRPDPRLRFLNPGTGGAGPDARPGRGPNGGAAGVHAGWPNAAHRGQSTGAGLGGRQRRRDLPPRRTQGRRPRTGAGRRWPDAGERVGRPHDGRMG